jgi:hypothetical protein
MNVSVSHTKRIYASTQDNFHIAQIDKSMQTSI